MFEEKYRSLDLGYDYEPIITRRRLTWPRNARVAVIVTVNIECWRPDVSRYGGPETIPLPISPDKPNLINYTWREYGPRVGIWRIIEHLDRHRIPVSATFNSMVGKLYPQIAAEVKKRGWELLGHSYFENDQLWMYTDNIEEERRVIRATIKQFEEVVGERPKGWLSPAMGCSPNTVRILAEEGFEYFTDYLNDDQPYPLRVGDKLMVSIPYTNEINDYLLFSRSHYDPNQFEKIVKEEFDVLYSEGRQNGRLFNLGVHPHVIGRPSRIRSLDRILNCIRGKKNVWFATRQQIADWYKKNYC